jgi:hypothetical protein
MGSTAVSEWEEMELLITVKAYPSVSMKYGEAVCVAGIRLDTTQPRWVRLFPVGFRDLPPEQRFGKYDVITLRAQRHTTDRRAESYRPDLTSIRVGQHLPAGGPWKSRRRWVDPLIGPTMCELHRARKGGGDGMSLAVVRPRRVIDIVVRDAEPWTHGQLATLNQASLLTEPKGNLEKPAHSFAYRWECEDPACKIHTQGIADWELGQAYRAWRRMGYDVIDAIRRRWLDDICNDRRETMFFVGDQHKRPGQFMVLGAFYPEYEPRADQLTLELAA